MQQRGSQLMQLLYHVLQEEDELGVKGICIDLDRVGLTFVPRSLTALTPILAARCELQQQEECGIAVPKVRNLVLLLLQSLFLQAPSWQELPSEGRLDWSNLMLRCLGELSALQTWRFSV